MTFSRASTVGVFVAICAMAGCSDPVGEPPRGGLQAQISAASAGAKDKSCPTPGVTLTVGSPPPTETVLGNPLSDGQEDSDINCSVMESNGTFEFEATMAAPGSNLSDSRFLATIPEGGKGTGSVALFLTQVGSLRNLSDVPCEFWVDRGDLTIAPGKIWAGFRCPQVHDQQSPSSLCGIPQGVVAFDRCDQ